MTEINTTLSNEQPIKSRSEDFLDRKYFADHLTNAIKNYEDKYNDSLTIGLYGKWGSGKTSIINMAVESLQKEENIIIFNFAPWLFSDTNQLISSFFKEFAQKINQKNISRSERMSSLGQTMETYASFFEPLSLIPEPSISILGKALSFSFSWAGKTSKKIGDASKKELSIVKKEIEEHLNKLDKKILIIIDDIDRLNNSEIKQTFQLIKSLGNFPNTIYLASMDKDVVVNALSEVQKGDGNEYLEKIINVPLEIPQLSTSDVQKFLFKKLDEILKDIDENDFDKSYWGNIFHSGYKNFFSNIRDVIRYINILKFNYFALKDKVNIIDLMAITAFQVFEPTFYEFMKYNGELLSGQESNDYYSSGKENKEKLKTLLDSYKNSLQKLDQNSFINLLKELFLKVNEAYSNVHHLGMLSQYRKESRVVSSEFYDAYFSLTLNSELTNNEIKKIISKTSSESDFSDVILQLIKENRITIFLQRIQDFTDKDIPKENFQVIFNVLMNLGDLIPEEKEGMFFFGNSMEIMRIFYQLYFRLDSEVDRYNLLRQSIENSKDSLHPACIEVSTLMQKHGEYEEHEEKDEKVITYEQLQELKKVLLDKIKLWVKNHLLFEHREALMIIYLWKRIDEEDCLEYIKCNIGSKEQLLHYLQIFIHYSFSHSDGDYTERKTRKFNYDAMKHFIDVETIAIDVRNIDSDLNELEKFCVDKFLYFYEKDK